MLLFICLCFYAFLYLNIKRCEIIRTYMRYMRWKRENKNESLFIPYPISQLLILLYHKYSLTCRNILISLNFNSACNPTQTHHITISSHLTDWRFNFIHFPRLVLFFWWAKLRWTEPAHNMLFMDFNFQSFVLLDGWWRDELWRSRDLN